jgi:hypothetical protein
VGDLLTVLDELNLAIEHQLFKLKKIVTEEKLRRPSYSSGTLYSDVVHNISNFALSVVHDCEYLDSSTACTMTLKATMGLPCIHVIDIRHKTTGKLRMSNFHRHWWLDQCPSIPHGLSIDDKRTTFDGMLAHLRSNFQNAASHEKINLLERIGSVIGRGQLSY